MTTAAASSVEALEPPPVDINAVGARERPFPWFLLVCSGLVVVLALLALALWLRTHPPFETSRKEDPPAAASPAATAPRLALAPDDAPPAPASVSGMPPIPAPQGAAAPSAPPIARPCVPSTVTDQRAARAGAGASSLTIDCNGQVKARAPASAGSAASPEPIDRYAGPVLLIWQEAPAGEGASPATPALAAPAAVLRPPAPLLPSPPLASPVTPILEQLRSQLGTLQPAGPPAATAPGASGGAPAARADKALAVRSLDENLTIPKGAQIDCTLTTRVVTEISGFASCLVSQNVYSANGRTLLIERMSEVQGEYATASAQTGQRNIHILWTRLRKPGGITLELASPATDGLGGAGLPGHVDNRWLDRIGSAYLLSFIKDAIAYQTAKDSAPGSSAAAAAYGNTVQQSNQLAEKVLDATINIRPTQYANQGARVAIYVARDLDFGQVYAVRPQ